VLLLRRINLVCVIAVSTHGVDCCCVYTIVIVLLLRIHVCCIGAAYTRILVSIAAYIYIYMLYYHGVSSCVFIIAAYTRFFIIADYAYMFIIAVHMLCCYYCDTYTSFLSLHDSQYKCGIMHTNCICRNYITRVYDGIITRSIYTTIVKYDVYTS